MINPSDEFIPVKVDLDLAKAWLAGKLPEIKAKGPLHWCPHCRASALGLPDPGVILVRKVQSNVRDNQ